MKKNDSDYCTFYIVRHGETHANAKGIIQGQKRVDGDTLNKIGESQAKKVAKELKKIKFDAVYSSDLIRAQKTAEIITLEHQLAVITTKALREKIFGSFEGKTHKELRDHVQALSQEFEKLSLEQKHTYKYDKGWESNAEANTRLTTFLRELAIGYGGKTILIVSHSAIMRAFLIILGWGTYEELPPNSLKNTAYIKLRSDGVDFFIDEVYGVEKAF